MYLFLTPTQGGQGLEEKFKVTKYRSEECNYPSDYTANITGEAGSSEGGME